jgi:3-hydroxyacyl-[acyl-carrier-protein] dehydratase
MNMQNEKNVPAMDIHAILENLPHRYPFILVDRVLSIEAGKSIVALKNVTINEPFFPGHYPHHPVMPGVLIIEAMAQVAALLSFQSMPVKLDEKSVYYFAGIDGARFKRPVTPGDQLIIKVELLRSMRGLYKFRAIAEVDGQLAAQTELMCTVKTVR